MPVVDGVSIVASDPDWDYLEGSYWTWNFVLKEISINARWDVKKLYLFEMYLDT